MLRITCIKEANASATLKVEGKLLAPWVDELLDACTGAAARSAAVRLDLSSVTFVDAAGADLLRDLIHRGTEIAACSGYLAALLHLEKR